MKLPQFEGMEYDARIRRAEKIIAENGPAAELLIFYRRIAQFQKSLIEKMAGRAPEPGMRQFASVRDKLELALVLPHFRDLLAVVEQYGPKALAEAAREMDGMTSESWAALLVECWKNGGLANQQVGAFERFFSRAILQPYAEYVRSRTAVPPVVATPQICPLCGGQPLLGVLRLEGDGGKRYLVCSFCGCEWAFQRILCAACGEVEEKKLPVYVAEQFPHIRVEACETCKFFLRTIDTTKDGHAVPIVDDLAAIPLTLWAHEHGYSRLQPNLLGS